MTKRQVSIVILCEDKAHEILTRRYLESAGYDSRKFRVRLAPPMRGDAKDFVVSTYPAELQSIRIRSAKTKRLIAMVDADRGTVQNREKQLMASAIAAELLPRQAGEHVVHLIPRRNIETWVHFLNGNDCDERTDYKRNYVKGEPEREPYRETADKIRELVMSNEDVNLPSLQNAILELRERL